MVPRWAEGTEVDGGRRSEGTGWVMIWRRSDREGGARFWMAFNVNSKIFN